jgi:hypothetical protein
MPLKEALKRRRLDMKKRREVLAKSNYNAPTTRLLLYTVASVFLGCIIVIL